MRKQNKKQVDTSLDAPEWPQSPEMEHLRAKGHSLYEKVKRTLQNKQQTKQQVRQAKGEKMEDTILFSPETEQR